MSALCQWKCSPLSLKIINEGFVYCKKRNIVLLQLPFCRLFPTVWIVVAKTVGIGVLLLYDSWGCSITPVSIKFLFPVERLVSEPVGLWLWK